MTSDNVLIDLVRAGHKEALGQLYDRYFDPIYRFCYYQTNRSSDAEDLTADVMLAMAEGIYQFRSESSFKNWLYQIAKNKILTWVRQNRYSQPLVSLSNNVEYIEVVLSTDNKKLGDITRLKTLFKSLSSFERQVLTLRYLTKASVSETAQKLSLTESNVKVITHRAIKKLRLVT